MGGRCLCFTREFSVCRGSAGVFSSCPFYRPTRLLYCRVRSLSQLKVQRASNGSPSNFSRGLLKPNPAIPKQRVWQELRGQLSSTQKLGRMVPLKICEYSEV